MSTNHAEQYELPELPPSPEAGPSRRPRPQRRRASTSTKSRTVTLHPTTSTANLLFSAPSGAFPSTRQRHGRTRSQSNIDQSEVPRVHRATFLSEDPYDDSEEVDLPDFGHMLGINDEGEDHFAVASGMLTRWKRKLYLLMEEPASSREAFFVHIIVTGAIIFSAILTTLSTMPAFHMEPIMTKTLFGLDTAIVVLFTIEYLARSLAHSDSWAQYYSWATSFFGLLDLLAILPYYIEVAQNEDTTILFRFSILRTFRLLRVFRAFKHQNQMLLTIEVMYVAVRRSKDALWALTFFIILVLVLFSTLIYFAERGTWDPSLAAFIDADGDPSAFDSIPRTAWFSLVTMSTVGYGEVVPKSFLGKLLTIPLLMFGLLLIALPSFVLGRNFAIVFDAMTRQLPKNVSSSIPTPRASIEQPTITPVSTDNIPLLPLSSQDAQTATPNGPSLSRPRSTSPFPGSGTTNQRAAFGNAPRMWEGGIDGMGEAKKERDLTNTKLAKNQLVLLEQIDLLRQTIDKQGEMLARLTEILNVKNKGKGPEKSKGLQEDHFTLGDSGEE
ncbi:hypothetical protein I305_06196 [Cryptococcus gattii E566]|uniref:Ion transport domain-containing protein n=2 Tax=Cryptococcus gattii TaxID=37769 RepID=E6R192_CRYGW|nr:uncharacterized protein CGB_B6610W [Cryptococcus gattii WM276]ADV20557.1 Conserved hypothetical protein [Cryptococcus gattii WM276]KIR76972.1 hypothetical protein I306_06125 [Cryptococcus gattii EJB2]KIY31292.1 hypothetical protein I305_06196 [Cryptococcus gattii E566]KJE01683.1 hypothetical protein I311_04721 [Cryptococcus gattii NT-10]